MEEIKVRLSFQEIKSALEAGCYLDLDEDLRKAIETIVANIFIDADEDGNIVDIGLPGEPYD